MLQLPDIMSISGFSYLSYQQPCSHHEIIPLDAEILKKNFPKKDHNTQLV